MKETAANNFNSLCLTRTQGRNCEFAGRFLRSLLENKFSQIHTHTHTHTHTHDGDDIYGDFCSGKPTGYFSSPSSKFIETNSVSGRRTVNFPQTGFDSMLRLYDDLEKSR